MVKIIPMDTLEYYEKWTENDTFHSTSKTENFKRVTFIMKVLP